MKAATLEDYKRRILRVLVHVQRHLDDDLDLAQLSGVAAFSPYHFHRIFRGMVGETVRDHVRRLRLERAAHRLKHSERTVTEVALDAGYETHEAFTRAFRAMFGESPSGYRRRRPVGPSVVSTSGVLFHENGKLDRFEPRAVTEEPMKVKIETIEPMRVAFIRHVGPYDGCARAWERLLTWAGAEGRLGAGTRIFGLCHDDPDVTPADRIRYDACITVDEAFTPRGEIGVQLVAGGEYAVTTHQGPYGRLGETYDRLFGEWLPRSGRSPRSAPCFEVYLNDPEGTEPEELLTDIHVALEPLERGG